MYTETTPVGLADFLFAASGINFTLSLSKGYLIIGASPQTKILKRIWHYTVIYPFINLRMFYYWLFFALQRILVRSISTPGGEFKEKANRIEPTKR